MSCRAVFQIIIWYIGGSQFLASDDHRTILICCVVRGAAQLPQILPPRSRFLLVRFALLYLVHRDRWIIGAR